MKSNCDLKLPHGFNAKIYDVLPSTSDLAKKLGAEGAPEGTVVIARAQTAGRGRQGKSFASPKGTGLYMSLILRPPFPSDPGMVTTAAAVAVSLAIEDISGRKPGIKWVNDVYLNGKKVCGILTEAGGIKDGAPTYIVLGIGINLTEPDEGFPEELSGIAGAVFPRGAKADVTEAARAVLKRFSELRTDMLTGGHVNAYREMSFLPGMMIDIVRPDGNIPARVIEVDEECRLVVETSRGIIRLSSGEVSIRIQKDPVRHHS